VYLKDLVGVVDQAVVTSHQHHNWTPINHLSPFAMIQADSLQKLFYLHFSSIYTVHVSVQHSVYICYNISAMFFLQK